MRHRRIGGLESSELCCLLLVRNEVSYDARVLRAARVAERTLGDRTLVVGVATTSTGAGETTVEGVSVLRLRTRKQRAGAPPRGADHSTSSLLAADLPSRLPWRARARRIAGGALFALRAFAVARRERPLVVHANDWNTMWCAAMIKLVCGARVIYDSHELWPDRNGRWEQRWWLLTSEALFVRVIADAVLTASPGYAEVLAKRYRTVPPRVIRNIPESHRTGSTSPSAHHRGLADPAGRPAISHRRPQAALSGGEQVVRSEDSALVVYVGGLLAGRGLEQTIDALALAPGIRLRTVGPSAPAYRASLLERAAAIGVADRLELQPPVAPAALSQTLSSATAGLCLIQPVCRSYELTLPNKLFEYAAAGVPVLASDLPVLGAIVRDQGLGEVVPPGDPQAIADGMRRLSESGIRSQAQQRTRAFARANNWREEAGSLAEVYRRLVPKGADGRRPRGWDRAQRRADPGARAGERDGRGDALAGVGKYA